MAAARLALSSLNGLLRQHPPDARPPQLATAIWLCEVLQPHSVDQSRRSCGVAEQPRCDPSDAAGANLEQAGQGSAISLGADDHDGPPRRNLHPCGARLHPQRTGPLLHDASDCRRRADAETWKTGPRAGQPKLGPAAQSLLDRGFVSLDPHSRPPHLFNPGG